MGLPLAKNRRLKARLVKKMEAFCKIHPAVTLFVDHVSKKSNKKGIELKYLKPMLVCGNLRTGSIRYMDQLLKGNLVNKGRTSDGTKQVK